MARKKDSNESIDESVEQGLVLSHGGTAKRRRRPQTRKSLEAYASLPNKVKARFRERAIQNVNELVEQAKVSASDALRHFENDFPDTDSLMYWSVCKLQVVESAVITLLKSCLEPTVLARASLEARARALKIVHEILRLESDKSTQNLAVNYTPHSL